MNNYADKPSRETESSVGSISMRLIIGTLIIWAIIMSVGAAVFAGQSLGKVVVVVVSMGGFVAVWLIALKLRSRKPRS